MNKSKPSNFKAFQLLLIESIIFVIEFDLVKNLLKCVKFKECLNTIHF